MNRPARPPSEVPAESSSTKTTPRKTTPRRGSTGAMDKDAVSAAASRLTVPGSGRRRSAGAFLGTATPPEASSNNASARPTPSPSPIPSPRLPGGAETSARRGSLGLPPESDPGPAADSGHQFSIGDTCFVGNAMAPGTVRFIGTAQFAEGIWFGLELDEALGKNDGTVRGTRYFDCKPLHGIFCRSTALVPSLPDEDAARRHGSFSSTYEPMPSTTFTAPVVQVTDTCGATTAAKATPNTTPTTTDSTEHNLQRELAEAVEDHDAPRIQEVMRKAVNGRLCPKELENAQRVLNFELSRSLFQEIEAVRSTVASLSDTVRAAGIQASAKLPVDNDLQSLDDTQGPSLLTIAGMIERSRDEIVSRLEKHQQQVGSELETVITRATIGIWEAISERSATAPSSSGSRKAPSQAPSPNPARSPDRSGRRPTTKKAVEAEALEEPSDDEPASAPPSQPAAAPSRSNSEAANRIRSELLQAAGSRRQSQAESVPVPPPASRQPVQPPASRCDVWTSEYKQWEGTVRLIQTAWRLTCKRRRAALTAPAYGEAALLLEAMNRQQAASSGSEDDGTGSSLQQERIREAPSQQQPTHVAQHADRPDLTGDWQFSFEGDLHRWHVNGTIAYTPDGADENGEQLEIVVENGKEMLNGWCLVGRSSDANMLLWEDTDSYERVVWIRSGHKLEGFLGNMEDDITISVVDSTNGSLLCELLAERTWLIFDLMEAVQDTLGIRPREQKLSHQGRPLVREDQPVLDIIPGASGEVSVCVPGSRQGSRRPSASVAAGEMAPARRPSMQDIKEASRCAHNTILAAVQLDPEALRHAPEDMTCDRELLLTAVRQGATLGSLRPEFRADKEIVMAALQKNGMSLQYADESLQADREVVLEAIVQDSRAIEFAALALQADQALLHAARRSQASELEDDEDDTNLEELKARASPAHTGEFAVPEKLATEAARAPPEADLATSPEASSKRQASPEAWDPDASQGAWDPDASLTQMHVGAWNEATGQYSQEEQDAWAATEGTSAPWQADAEWNPDAKDAAATSSGGTFGPLWGALGWQDSAAAVEPTVAVPELKSSPELASDAVLPSAQRSPRELTPREIIAEQDIEYQESELVDAKKQMDARVKRFAGELEKHEQDLEDAEDALHKACGRLERYGSNPTVEEEKEAAQSLVEHATQCVADSRKQLEQFQTAASTLEAELLALSSERQHDSEDECAF